MSVHINKQLTKNASLAHAKNAGNRNEVQVKVNSEPHATLNEYEPSRPRAGLTLSNSRDCGNAPRIRVARTATPPLTPRIRGARTERVQLVEVGECRLGRVTNKRSLQTNYDNDDIEATYEENRSLLLKAFGSKRSKRISDIGSKMRINSEMMTSQIEHSAADVTVDLKELELADSTLDTCLPLCHRNVTSITDVYPLHDFLTQSQLDSLEDEAFTVATLMPFTAEESGYSQFFIDAIERLQNKVNTERIKILLFVEALLRFINIPLKKLKKSDLGWKICPFSTEIAKKILEEFMINSAGGRTRNVVMDDKIVIHLIILVIISCDFVCNIDELSKYLPKFSIVKMGQMARALCLSSRDKITWFLKLPLPPARSFYMRKRK
ncbi:hypothetical protein J6590_065876 [Homalodisca vitripennis]|nr:hypothetical protein J6590_065876 [Homalodisca vitripennis]